MEESVDEKSVEQVQEEVEGVIGGGRECQIGSSGKGSDERPCRVGDGDVEVGLRMGPEMGEASERDCGIQIRIARDCVVVVPGGEMIKRAGEEGDERDGNENKLWKARSDEGGGIKH